MSSVLTVDRKSLLNVNYYNVIGTVSLLHPCPQQDSKKMHTEQCLSWLIQTKSLSECLEWNPNLLPQPCMHMVLPNFLERPFTALSLPHFLSWSTFVLTFPFSQILQANFPNTVLRDEGQATFLCLVRSQLKAQTCSASPSTKTNPNGP